MIRPKAIDGVVVHTLSSKKTRTPRQPKKVSMVSDSFQPEMSVPPVRRAPLRKKTPITNNDSDDQLTFGMGNRTTKSSFFSSDALAGKVVTRTTGRHYIVAAVAVVLLVIFMGVFRTARVSAYPAIISQPLSVNINQIRIESVTVTDSVTNEIIANESQAVESYATGTVRLFNEEATAQKLKSKTRLEDTTGKIYFLPEAGATIPAAVAGVPGSIDVVVTAEKPGALYNQKATDFVLPGWREVSSPKFKTQYGRSISDITGGEAGSRPVIDTVEYQRLQEAMKVSLTERLRARALKEIPVDWLLLPTTEVITANEPTSKQLSTGKAQVTMTGKLSGKLVHRSQLGTLVAQKTLYSGKDVLAIDIANPVVTATTISGVVRAEVSLNESEVFKLLDGIPRKNILKTLETSGRVSKAQVTIHPKWARLFPKSQKRVTIDIQSNIDVPKTL